MQLFEIGTGIHTRIRRAQPPTNNGFNIVGYSNKQRSVLEKISTETGIRNRKCKFFASEEQKTIAAFNSTTPPAPAQKSVGQCTFWYVY